MATASTSQRGSKVLQKPVEFAFPVKGSSRSKASSNLPIGKWVPQNLKNITKPIEVFSIEVDETGGTPGQSKPNQEIKYCRTADGVRLAYAISGNGPPLVKAANWMNHLEYDWESPVWRHVFRGLSTDHTLIRYDARGNGMSDWDVDELSLDAWVSDLETVVDAARLERFPLIGISQGCAVAVSYAVRHPERVSHLVLYRYETALQSRRQSIQSARPRGAKDKAPRCVKKCALVRPYPRCRGRSAYPRTERGSGAADCYFGSARNQLVRRSPAGVCSHAGECSSHLRGEVRQYVPL